MNGRDAATAFATALVDEWARAECTHAVVAPGSRSAPLALALARDDRIGVTVVHDERSAAFHALGIGLATGRPAVLCCTSGTAAANFHPAVLEAAHARVPMIVCTADRPPELRDTGAGQTIDQQKLYGDAVRWFADAGPPHTIEDAGATWRSLACRAVAAAAGPPAGPVHLNLPFREPLVPTGEPLFDVPGRPDGRPWVVSTPAPRRADDATVQRLADEVRAHSDGVLLAGWGAGVSAATAQRFARAARWPLLADAVSNVRSGRLTVSTYEALLRDERFASDHRPSFAMRVGAPLTSKVANAWVARATRQLVIDPDDAWLDPAHTASERAAAAAEPLLAALADVLEADGASLHTGWLDGWLDAERHARAALDDVLDAAAAPFEGVIARDLASALPDGATLVVASSLPVRALEWCMAPRDGLRVLANRGVNGIDGFVSTTLGVAAASETPAPVVGFCGDLCFLHDTNGLLRASGRAAVPATFVVVDNDGGGIFSFLPQRDLPEFETLFGTPHGLDLVDVARAHGVAADRVDDLTDLKDALSAQETRVLVLTVDRQRSVEHHRALWSAVARGLS
jgi:2-succinyl-5-enolpyruvyl-6-hydroxy-3-cyclohexene-1-carboxylate synthase